MSSKEQLEFAAGSLLVCRTPGFPGVHAGVPEFAQADLPSYFCFLCATDAVTCCAQAVSD